MLTENIIASEAIEIDAPVELVWNILVNFDNYGAWNSFCPQVTAELKLGSPIKMQIDLGFGPQEQVEYICLIEPNKAIAWGMENKEGDPIHAVRTQTLTRLGDSRCSYLSSDEFSGPGVPDMMTFVGKAVEDGFNACARDLKAYAEKQSQG